MATKKITDLTNVTSVQDADLLIVETSEGTRSISKGNLLSGVLPTTGGALTGDLLIEHPNATESKVRVVNSLHDGNFTTSVNGNFGIYDNTYTKWIVKSDPNGSVEFYGNADTVDGYHVNTAIGASGLKPIYAGTSDMTAGTTTLAQGNIYIVYE